MAEKPDSVVARRFVEGKRTSDVLACVKSQSGIAERFDTGLVLDATCDRIVDYSCDCPAARKYGVMCKHGVALALAFRQDPASFDGYSASLVPRSSTSVLGFLEGADDFAGERMPEGSVHISLSLSQAFGRWTAEFSITAQGMTYVMADLPAFVRALSGGRYHSYGKLLGFVHTYDCLDDVSKRLALLIADIVARTEGMRTSRRHLELTEQDVVRMLDAIGSDTFTFVDEEYGAEPVQTGLVDGDPEISLRIVPAGDGMYEILRGEDMYVALGCGHACVIMDGTAYRCTGSFAHAASFLQSVYLSSDDELLISMEDLPRFCQRVLPVLESSMDTSVPAEFDAFRPKEPHFSFYLDRVGKGRESAIELEVRVAYGAREHVLLAPARRGDGADGAAEEPQAGAGSADTAYRDEAAEAATVELAFEYFDASMDLPLEDVEGAGRLLYEGVARMQAAGDVYTTPEFDRLVSSSSMRVRLGLSISGDLINLDIKPTDLEAAELAALLSSYQKKRHFHRLKNGTIASLENIEMAELDRMMQDLGLKASDLARGSVELPTYNAFLLDREYAEAIRDESFEEYIYRFDNDSELASPPPGLAPRLRPYQLEGFRWLSKLAEMGFGGILADEMGLGKSIQMIAFLQAQKESGALDRPALIVCPASLVYNWTGEFAKFAPGLAVCPIDGTASERAQKRRQRGVDVFVASYDAVRQDVESFADIDFSVVVLDEAQFIKNHATKTARAVKRLRARHRFALTGTPIENRLSEIWSIMDFLMPGFLGTYALFRRRYETDILGGDERVAARLQALVGPFVLRRLKSEVLTDLPEKQESVVRVALDGEQQRLYDAQEQQLRIDLLAQRKAAKARRSGRAKAALGEGTQVDVLAELMHLRQTALEPSLVYSNYRGGSAKTAAILELVAEAMESGRKALVFSQFTSYLDVLKPELERRGVRYYEITGKTPKRERVEMAESFNADDVPVFLVSLKAGGTGLNLTGASIVIHADPWWNAAATNQATDRAHRIGQDEMVSVYKVIAKGTIEERILELQAKKEQLADSVVGETSLASLSSLTRAELEDLLLND